MKVETLLRNAAVAAESSDLSRSHLLTGQALPCAPRYKTHGPIDNLFVY